MIDLEDLVRKGQSGDKEALEEIIKMYKPFVIKNARQIYINGYELEDLVQVGNMALIKAVNKYQLGRKVAFTTYAITVIKNAFNEELRKVISKKWDEKFKCSLNSLNENGIEFVEMLVSDEDVEEDSISKEQVTILRKALENLSEDEREIINWFYFEDKPLREYAEAKGIALNTAAKRKRRAIDKLRDNFFRDYMKT